MLRTGGALSVAVPGTLAIARLLVAEEEKLAAQAYLELPAPAEGGFVVESLLMVLYGKPYVAQAYDTIRGKKTLQRTSIAKRHFALSSRFWSPRGPQVIPRSPQ